MEYIIILVGVGSTVKWKIILEIDTIAVFCIRGDIYS